MNVADTLDFLGTLVRQLQGALGGQTWRSGTAVLTFAAGTNSNTVTVTHDLGTTPTEVVATAHSSPAFGKIPRCNTANFTATTFQINGEITTAHTGDIPVGWIATG
jgi:hypothetical protein